MEEYYYGPSRLTRLCATYRAVRSVLLPDLWHCPTKPLGSLCMLRSLNLSSHCFKLVKQGHKADNFGMFAARAFYAHLRNRVPSRCSRYHWEVDGTLIDRTLYMLCWRAYLLISMTPVTNRAFLSKRCSIRLRLSTLSRLTRAVVSWSWSPVPLWYVLCCYQIRALEARFANFELLFRCFRSMKSNSPWTTPRPSSSCPTVKEATSSSTTSSVWCTVLRWKELRNEEETEGS